MHSPAYQGLCIVVSDAAMRELMKHEKTLYDVVDILEHGYDAPRKRASTVIERWLNKGAKTYNVVVAKDYSSSLAEECWILIHFGKFTRRKK